MASLKIRRGKENLQRKTCKKNGLKKKPPEKKRPTKKTTFKAKKPSTHLR
jgi:hypothetical protein